MFPRPSLRSTVTTLAAAAVLVGGADLASYAATGHPLVLGKANSAVGTTSLKNLGRGPALSLNSAKSSPPLVVNSSKLVKHLNANKVGGLTAGQLNPPQLTVKIGSALATLSNAQHLRKIPSPAGLYQIDIRGLWQPGVGDTIQCLVVDQSVFTTMDASKVYVVTFTKEGDTNQLQILGGGYAQLHKGNTLVVGCDTETNTGTDTLLQPVSFTFTKVTQHVVSGRPITVPRNARSLLHR